MKGAGDLPGFFAGQKTFWGKSHSRREPDHPVVRAFAEPKVAYIRTCIELIENGSVIENILDVGCGNGYFTMPLNKWARCVVGLDFSEKMLASNPVAVRKVCADAAEIPFNDNTFDLVVCSNLLHHVSDPLQVVLEMKRVSRRYVAASEPNAGNPLMFGFGVLKPVERGTLKFTKNYLAGLASKAGLAILRITTMGIVLPRRTPTFMLPILRRLDGESPLGFFNTMICRK